MPERDEAEGVILHGEYLPLADELRHPAAGNHQDERRHDGLHAEASDQARR